MSYFERVLIGNSETFNTPVNSSDGSLFSLPNSDKSNFGNLTLSLMESTQMTRIINEKIILIYQNFEHLKSSAGKTDESSLILFNKVLWVNQMLHEELIYWLRVQAEKLLSLYSLALEYKENIFPNQIPAHNIGSFLDTKNKDTDKVRQNLQNHYIFIKRLNNISNAYKHSMLTAESRSRFADAPSISVLYLKYGKLLTTQKEIEKFTKIYDPKVDGEHVGDGICDFNIYTYYVLTGYNEFYNDILSKLRSL